MTAAFATPDPEFRCPDALPAQRRGPSPGSLQGAHGDATLTGDAVVTGHDVAGLPQFVCSAGAVGDDAADLSAGPAAGASAAVSADEPQPSVPARPVLVPVPGLGQEGSYEVALAGLLRCAEPPVPAALRDFVTTVGAEAAWDAIARRAAPPEVLCVVAPRLGALTAAALDAQARADLALAARLGARIIGAASPEWPGDCWPALDWTRACEACPHTAAPLALYCRGLLLPTSPEKYVSVVGSRAATQYGTHLATELGAEIAYASTVVVSGAAFGIDAAAHRGALHAARADAAEPVAVTVAVLPCGIDRAYPAAHRDLIDAIAGNGTAITEYPPGSGPMRHRFLVRNRLIAALGAATVVVEAGRRSGSLNTATTAANLGRHVCAMPGPVTSAMSVGSHDLIRDGRASLVTTWTDIATLIRPLAGASASPATAPREGPGPGARSRAAAPRPIPRPADGLDLVASRVYDALPPRGEASVDDLVREVALPAPDVLGALAVLYTLGLARRRDGRWTRAR